MDKHFALSVGPSEKVEDFNQCFTTTLNKFEHGTTFSQQELQIEVYTNALSVFIFVFIKRVDKNIMAATFEEEKQP